MRRNIVPLTKAISFWCLTPLNCSAFIPSVLQAVQIRHVMRQLQEPKEHLFVPAVRTHISEFWSGNNFVIGGWDWNVLFVDFIEDPVVPPIDRDVGTIDSATFASFLDHVCLVVGEYLPHSEKYDANEAREV